ncbi:hypothetical protein NIES4074_46340 [Cylindrospermum sp. NIES-4074]|nr:hypothetical protein NIES4074_46340 [Cylindrospermum sp. NIES-4074]
MVYKRVQKNSSSSSQPYKKGTNKKSDWKNNWESPFAQRGFGIQPQADTDSTPQEIPSNSQGTHKHRSTNLLSKVLENIQRQALTEAQQSQSQPAPLPETQNLNQTTPFQTKLTIGAPGDMYEQEADKIAEQVMSMDAPTPNPQPIQRQSEETEENIQRQPLTAPITPLTQLSSETVQKKGEGSATPATPSLESRLGSQTGGGTPLDEQTRSFMEPRFGVDFNQVRVHTDTTAVQMNKELGAQAFAHGSDIYFGAGKTPGKNELTAHELTHVVQQGGAVRMNPETLRAKKLVNPQVSTKMNKEPGLIPKRDHPESVQLQPLEAKQLSTNATSIAINKDLHRFPDETQTLQAKQLLNSDNPLDSNKEKRPFPQQDHQLVQAKHISTLSVSPRIQGNWFGDLFDDGKRKLLDSVEQRLKNIPGYDLLILALGRNPITGEAVERNGTKAVGAFLKLVPGGDQIFEKLQQSGALEKAFTWWQEEITKLNITVENIKGLVKQAIDSIEWKDTLDIDGAIERVKGFFKPTIERVKNFATNVSNKVLEFTLEGFMQGDSGAISKVMAILKKAGNVFGTIASDPIKFCQNLMKAVTGGFEQFKNNFGQHFQTGMMKWLFGTLATAGLTAPSEFNAQGLISIALEVLGLTYQNIRPKLVKKVGEKKLAKAEQGVEILQKILQGGLAQAWQNISEMMENVEQQKEEMIGKLRDMVVEAVIGAAIPKLLAMFVPGGAIIEAVMNVYKTITFFIDKAQEIADLANAVFDSIGNIAAGNVAAASNLVEKVMGRSLSLIISFLAKLIGVGNLGHRVRKLIEGIKDKIDKALDKLVAAIADKVQAFLKNPGQNPQPGVVAGQNPQPRGGQGQTTQPHGSSTQSNQNQSTTASTSNQSDHDKKVRVGLDQIDTEETKYLKNGKISKEDAKRVANKVKEDNKIFKAITVVDGDKTWDYKWVASDGIEKGKPKAENSSEEAELRTKLVSLKFFSTAPKDVDRIIKNLEKSSDGAVIGGYITSGYFDNFDGYKTVISSIKNFTSLPSVRMALQQAEYLLKAGYKTIVFEKQSTPPGQFDIDVAVVDTNGKFSMVYQLKYAENNGGVSQNATSGAKQLKNAPATEKWVVIEVANGTWEEFQNEGREKGINTTFKSKFPDIKLQIKFSDGIKKTF